MRNGKPKAKALPAARTVGDVEAEIARARAEMDADRAAELERLTAAVRRFVGNMFPRHGAFGVLVDPGHGRCPLLLGLEGSEPAVRKLLAEDDHGVEDGAALVYWPADVKTFFG